jgi:hypothetical protein
MNFSVFTLALLFFFFQRQDDKYSKEFKIGQFTYVITPKESHSHDDDFTVTFLSSIRRLIKATKLVHINWWVKGKKVDI